MDKLKIKIRKQLGIEEDNFNIAVELLSGIVVAIALVPEAISFSLIAGVDPMIGIYSAFMMGLVAALFGGRPAMITGATGAIAVVYAPMIEEFGVEYLFLAVIIAGIFQIILGMIGAAKFSKIIPYPVILGFLNGLALVILLGQVEMFKVPGEHGTWLQGSEMTLMIILTLISILLTMYYQSFMGSLKNKFNKESVIRKILSFFESIPNGLMAIIVVTIISLIINNINIYTIKDLAGRSLEAGFPTLVEPNLNINSVNDFLSVFYIVLPFAITASLVGLIESLLTLNVLDEVTDTKGNEKKESIAQGIANIATGLIGGMGGCAMIGQSNINVNNKARTYVSSISAAIILLILVMVFSTFIDIIPLAALTGIMIVVVIKTFAWDSIIARGRFTNKDLFLITLVTILTVVWNLSMAVIIGSALAAIFFAWEKGERIKVEKEESDNSITYKVNGILFFSSTKNLTDQIELVEGKDIILDMSEALVRDSSAVKMLEELSQRQEKRGAKLYLENLNEESKIKIHRNHNRVKLV